MMTYRKKLIEVALPLDAINADPPARSPFGKVTLAPFIFGGRENLWLRRELLYFHHLLMIQASTCRKRWQVLNENAYSN